MCISVFIIFFNKARNQLWCFLHGVIISMTLDYNHSGGNYHAEQKKMNSSLDMDFVLIRNCFIQCNKHKTNHEINV